MARSIARVYSWAVTGTPVGNRRSSRSDIRGIMCFLNMEYEYSKIRTAYDLFWVLKMFMRRTTKASVRNELHLPPQHENLILLSFNEVEEQYYKDLRNQMIDDVGKYLTADIAVEKDEESSKKIRHWLLILRQTW